MRAGSGRKFCSTENGGEQAERASLRELLQALHDAQSDIGRLTAENLKLHHEANGDLNNEVAILLVEVASLKQQH